MYETEIKKLPEFGAWSFKVNEKDILKTRIPCLMEIIQSRIDRATLDSHFVESFEIYGVHSYFNWLLGRILMQDIHPDGFKYIYIGGLSCYEITDLSIDLLNEVANNS